MIRRVKILPHQIGLHFRDEQFVGIMQPGIHWIFDPFKKQAVSVVSTREVILEHDRVKDVVRSGALKGRAVELELTDHQRALVWVDNRFHRILAPGTYVIWTAPQTVRTEIVDAHEVRFEHRELGVISRHPSAGALLNVCDVSREHAGVYHCEGRYKETFEPGRYAFWKNVANTRVVEVDMRERMVDVTGQELMTADNVTLRMNAVVAYKIVDAWTAVKSTQDVQQSLYREAQLVLREMIGTRGLDELLANKQSIAAEAQSQLQQRVAEFGVSIASVGIRDVILPGEMKELLNQVTQAKKAAEANLISRREETAAMRSQANTAKLLDSNPTLMRLRELEVLEKVASSSNLQVALGNGESLNDRLTKLI